MNVMDLRKLLEELHPDLPIVTSGYEYGIEEINTCEEVTIAIDYNDPVYGGKDEIIEDENFERYAEHSKKQAVYLGAIRNGPWWEPPKANEPQS